MTRYHPLLVAIHWLMAILIVTALVFGTLVLAPTPNDDPAKLFSLRAHSLIGVSVGLLLLVRLALRLGTRTPPHAATGSAALDRLGPAVHWAFYVAIFLMVASGLGMALLAGLPGILFGGSEAALPETFDDLAPRAVHGLVASLLMALVLLHVAAAIYHQAVLKDGLLRRMWFGARRG